MLYIVPTYKKFYIQIYNILYSKKSNTYNIQEEHLSTLFASDVNKTSRPFSSGGGPARGHVSRRSRVSPQEHHLRALPVSRRPQ